ILSTTKDIVLLPDSVRPEFFNGPEEADRVERKKADAKRWEEEQAKPESERDKRVRKPFQWLDNYTYALTAQPFYRFFLNTIFVTITVTSVSLFFASLAAYAFAFFKFPLKDTIFMMLLGTMMLPQQALLIPNYIFLSKIHWVNSYLALTVPWLASAYAVFFLRQFFMQLPKDLFDAAVIDGCTRFQFYYKIALPLCKPPMVTLAIFTFLSNWNAFVWPLIVTNDTNLRVIQVGLSYFSSEAGTRWGPLMAASTMTILPLVIMYFLAQKQFVESQATSGMKE
ncbi:MAG: carbohydrate ABC transporter permease, partial [Candidatus Riflebacteria bacterium]